MSPPEPIDTHSESVPSRPLLPALWVSALLAVTLGGAILFIKSEPAPTSDIESPSADNVRTRGLNGFDLTRATVPVSMILSGGPDRDGIPALDHPNFVAADQGSYLRPDDVVISLTLGGVTRAYPLRILVWHEAVNDVVGGQAVVVTYCPLCGSAMAFGRELTGRTLSFGISGLLYQSDVLLYDRETESLWSQMAMKAVSGEFAGTPLEWLVSEHLSWGEWKQRYPAGEVLSAKTGFERDYSHSPYRDYETSAAVLFPVPVHRPDLAPKDWIVGVVLDGVPRAYPLDLMEAGQSIHDTPAGLEINRLPNSPVIEVRHLPTGRPIPSVRAYWFAWQAFYPGTTIWNP